jgi:hypothetical protein
MVVGHLPPLFDLQGRHAVSDVDLAARELVRGAVSAQAWIGAQCGLELVRGAVSAQAWIGAQCGLVAPGQVDGFDAIVKMLGLQVLPVKHG